MGVYREDVFERALDCGVVGDNDDEKDAEGLELIGGKGIDELYVGADDGSNSLMLLVGSDVDNSDEDDDVEPLIADSWSSGEGTGKPLITASSWRSDQSLSYSCKPL